MEDLRPEVLRGDRAEQILRRVVVGDPLRVGERCTRALRRGGWLVCPDRLTLTAMAEVSLWAVGWRGETDVEAFVEGCVERAVRLVVDQQEREELDGLPLRRSEDAGFHRRLSDAYGLEVELCRTLCVEVNRMDDEHRRTFHRFFVQGEAVEEQAARDRLPPSAVEERLRRASRTVADALDRARRGGGR